MQKGLPLSPKVMADGPVHGPMAGRGGEVVVRFEAGTAGVLDRTADHLAGELGRRLQGGARTAGEVLADMPGQQVPVHGLGAYGVFTPRQYTSAR